MTSLAAEAKTTSTSIDEFKAAFAGLVEEHILEDENVNQVCYCC